MLKTYRLDNVTLPEVEDRFTYKGSKQFNIACRVKNQRRLAELLAYSPSSLHKCGLREAYFYAGQTKYGWVGAWLVYLPSLTG